MTTEPVEPGSKPCVVMVTWSYWPGHEGGAEKQCGKVIPHLRALGWNVEVWTAATHQNVPARDEEKGYPILRFGAMAPITERWLNRLGPTSQRLASLLGGNSRRKAKRSEALKFWLSIPLQRLARRSFIQAVCRHLSSLEEPPVLFHVHEAGWVAGATAWLAQARGIPVLAKTALDPALPVIGFDVPFRNRLSLSRRRCEFVAMAQYLAEECVHAGVTPDRVHVVPNGVQPPENARWPRAPGSRNVISVANFSQGAEHKAFDVLLHAWVGVFAEIPDAQLLLLGDGDTSGWKAMARDLGIADSVSFLGWVEDPEEYYHTAGAFVLPSRKEGVSNALLEAQSWGLPCVVSDIPGNLAVVDDDANGLVVPTNDAEALRKALLRVLQDAGLAQRLGDAARKRAEADFDIASVARKFDQLYAQMIQFEEDRP